MKKPYFKKLCVCLSLLILLSCVPTAVSAETYNGYCGGAGNEQNITWSFDASSGTLSFVGTGAMANWRHPTSFDQTYKQYFPDEEIVYVYTPWFSLRGRITNVTLSDGITTLGDFALSGCANLTDVSLGNDVLSVGIGAMESCPKLETVVLPDRITNIDVAAFYNDTSLVNITLPQDLETIRQGAFYGCSAIKQLDLPAKVHTINAGAFMLCKNMVSIHIPEGVLGISSYTFSNCSMLNSVQYDGPLQYINDSAFKGCTRLRTFTIPETCTSIAAEAFEKKNRITLRCYEGSAGYEYATSKGFLNEIAVHDYRLKNTVEADCTSGGYELFYCEECGRSYKENETECLGHDHIFDHTVAPTCTANGYTLYTCTRCADCYQTDVTAALPHTYGAWSISRIATETEDGVRHCYCTECQTEQTKVYPYHLPGDTDLNGKVEVFDLVLLLQQQSGLVSFAEEALSAGDVNGNCVIDAEDSTMMLQKMLGLLSAYPIE